MCVFFWIEGYFLGGCDANFVSLLDGGSLTDEGKRCEAYGILYSIGAVHFKHRPTYLILGVRVRCLGNNAV